MTLQLLRDTETDKPDAATEAPAPAPPETRTCPKCSAPLEDGQDWCLNCGEAQPGGRRVSLPGKRATATVLALTTVLVGGAVAASYAALQDGSETATPPAQLAQVPTASQAAPAPTTAVPDASTAVPSDTVPSDTSAAPSDTDSLLPPDAGDTPDIPDSSGGTSSPADTTTSDTTTGTSTGTTKTDSTADTRTSTSTTKTETETEPVKIDLADGAGSLYDPFTRDTAAGDAAKAFDGDPNTSFPVTVAPGSTQIGAGLAVALPKLQGVREIELKTKTPGFKIEIYATDEEDLPPDVLDTRWAHLKDVKGVGSDTDGAETVNLGSGSTKYRHVLLWFTAPPTEGSTVRISELKLLG
ncbi:hypothetical protein [Baekduia sp. Peel2402]|uniref:hypothetical protein n=1 Tax=Baekduia sp. Peel2402 TaxID=3458296 RepID=UPI00403E8DD7